MGAPEKIVEIIFGSAIVIVWLGFYYGMKILQYKNAPKATSDEVEQLRKEVVLLRQTVGDLMWQVENKDSQKIEPSSVEERLNSPELNNH